MVTRPSFPVWGQRVDPDLAQVIDAWNSLPPDTRTAILAIVEATQGR